MRDLAVRLIATNVLWSLIRPAALQPPSDAAKTFKANCVLCHCADGSGDSATGKAMHAKDLRYDEVQKQSDAALAEAITKGKGKMPAFGAKIHPEDVTKLVAYIRDLANKK
jgi:mono/diheme cytochrome c family protein